MFESAGQQVRERSDTLRRRCVACAHSEFVHADHAPRWCLFSECACSDYTVGVPEAEPRDARRRGAA
jgi:hypothetical protein